jgi:hypothetical protein
VTDANVVGGSGAFSFSLHGPLVTLLLVLSMTLILLGVGLETKNARDYCSGASETARDHSTDELSTRPTCNKTSRQLVKLLGVHFVILFMKNERPKGTRCLPTTIVAEDCSLTIVFVLKHPCALSKNCAW